MKSRKELTRLLISKTASEPAATRSLVELLSRPAERPKLARFDATGLRSSLGPWRLQQTRPGHWKWSVVDESKQGPLERFQWRPRPLSSAKKAGVKRVVLIGESAAGSYGYGGAYCLSSAVEHELGSGFEVIDLTCVNALWDVDCLEAVRAAVTLQPDLVLVYCGNNEAKSMLANLQGGAVSENPHAFAARWAFDEADPTDRVRALNRCLEFHIKNLVHRTVHACRAWDVDVAFVIPEFNIGDWRPVERVPHHLAGAALMTWLSEIARADASLAQGDFASALASYRAAEKLDGGMCQRSVYGAARSLSGLGRLDASYECFARARDAGLGPFVNGMPGTTTGCAAVMRDTFAALDVPFVDSPALFRKAAKNGIPGRELFIDYCHLSPRGHEILGYAAARMIEKACSAKRPRKPRPAAFLQPSPREEALGAFMGAFHNYNNAQELELVRHWLTVAHQTWKGIAPILAFFADQVCSSFRERWTIEQLEKAGVLDGLTFYYRFFVARCFYHARFDPELKGIIEHVLGRTKEVAAKSLERQTRGLLRDLDDRLQSRFFLDRHQGLVTMGRRDSRHGWEQPALEILAVEPEGRVMVPWDEKSSANLEIELTCIAHAGKLTISVDGKRVGKPIVVGRGVRRVVVAIPLLAKGLHELSLRFSAMQSLSDAGDVESRRAYVERFGYYPVAARLFGMWLRRADAA